MRGLIVLSSIIAVIALSNCAKGKGDEVEIGCTEHPGKDFTQSELPLWLVERTKNKLTQELVEVSVCSNGCEYFSYETGTYSNCFQ